jgi:hypothetical protein
MHTHPLMFYAIIIKTKGLSFSHCDLTHNAHNALCFFFFWFFDSLTFFFNFIFIQYIDLGLDLIIFFSDLVLGPYSVEKQIQHSVDA